MSQEYDTPRFSPETLALPMAANTSIFAGQLVCLNEAGFAVPASAAANLTCAGRAEQSRTNPGAAGAEVVAVLRKHAFKVENDPEDPVTQAQLLQPCYLTGAHSVAASHADNTLSLAGKVVGLEASGVWVEIN